MLSHRGVQLGPQTNPPQANDSAACHLGETSKPLPQNLGHHGKPSLWVSAPPPVPPTESRRGLQQRWRFPPHSFLNRIHISSAFSCFDVFASLPLSTPPNRAAGARTRQPENSSTFQGPGLQKHNQNSKRPSKRGERRKKIVAGGGKKSAKLGPPPFWAPHPSGLHPSGPHPSGPHPSGPHFCLVWGSILQGILSSQNSTSKNWPKSKLAEVELAELEKESWPKSITLVQCSFNC